VLLPAPRSVLASEESSAGWEWPSVSPDGTRVRLRNSDEVQTGAGSWPGGIPSRRDCYYTP